MIVQLKNANMVICPHKEVVGCMGSRCMAWRWVDPLRPKVVLPEHAEDAYNGDDEPERPADLPESYQWSPPDGDPGCWVEPDEEANQRRNGYCGLAGRPDL